MAMSSLVGYSSRRAREPGVDSCEYPLPAPKRTSDGVQPFAMCGASEATSGGFGDVEVVRDPGFTRRSSHERWGVMDGSYTGSYTGVERAEAV
jgi:hypothetical protein